MFIQLHGDIPIAQILKRHAREFREHLQQVPRVRSGDLLKAPLQELSAWSRTHPESPRVAPGTINKQLGAVQAIANWGHQNGIVPEDVPWSDPFQKTRVEEEQSERTSFTASELQAIFDTPLFTEHETPVGAKGDAGVWLPLVALFSGARQAEIAGLKVSNVQDDSAPLLFIVANRKAGKRLKTRVSERVIPIHPQLARLGFLEYVRARARGGEDAWLFPTVAPDQYRALAAWSKWFNRSFLRNTVGIKDKNKVFHSFRHVFQDALRSATPDEELRDTIQGRRNQGSVSRGYGAKAMLDRWGVARLHETISNIAYSGLNLSRVQPTGIQKRPRGSK